MGVSVKRAMYLYGILASGCKLSASEKRELEEYTNRFKTKEEIETEDLLKDL